MLKSNSRIIFKIIPIQIKTDMRIYEVYALIDTGSAISIIQSKLANEELIREFWIKQSEEYLPIIAVRSKWFKKTEPLEEGDLVFICNESGWIRGRIKEVFKDPESQQVREANIYTFKKKFIVDQQLKQLKLSLVKIIRLKLELKFIE